MFAGAGVEAKWIIFSHAAFSLLISLNEQQGSFLDCTSEPVNFAKYKEIYAGWHDTLGKAFLGCLEAKSKGADDRFTNLRVRSAINILTRLVRIYPTRPDVGDLLFKRLKSLQEDESRQDTKVMANAYVAQLTKATLEGCWKEQTASQKRDRDELEQARAEERKKRSEQTQREMAEENAQIEKKITGDRGRDRGRGDHSRYGRERDKVADRRKADDKVVVRAVVLLYSLRFSGERIEMSDLTSCLLFNSTYH